MHYNVDNPTQDVTWELRNAQDDVVLGPYELGAKTGPASYQFVFDPTTLNAGVALPDGAYKIALTLSEGAESLTDDVTIHLAFDPPRDTTVDVLESQRDVWPGFRRYHLWVGDYTRARIVTGLLPGVDLPEFGSASPGTFRVRTLGGALVRRDTVPGSFPGDMPPDDRYEWTWDGKNGNGRVQGPGEYRLTLTANDNWGRATTVPAGSMWVGHLANLTKTARFEPQEARNGYGNVIGRCSSVTYPGPHSWPGSAGCCPTACARVAPARTTRPSARSSSGARPIGPPGWSASGSMPTASRCARASTPRSCSTRSAEASRTNASLFLATVRGGTTARRTGQQQSRPVGSSGPGCRCASPTATSTT